MPTKKSPRKKKVYKTVYSAYRWGTKEDQLKALNAQAKKTASIDAVFHRLRAAIKANDRKAIIRLLKQWGVVKYSTYGSFPLDEAVLAHNNDAVRIILDAAADINQKNFEGSTALITASSKGFADTVRILLDAGADPTVVDQFENTALSRAKKEGYTDIVALLTARISNKQTV